MEQELNAEVTFPILLKNYENFKDFKYLITELKKHKFLIKYFVQKVKFDNKQISELIYISNGNLDILESLFVYQLFPYSDAQEITKNPELKNLEQQRFKNIKTIFRILRNLKQYLDKKQVTECNKFGINELNLHIKRNINKLNLDQKNYLSQAFTMFPDFIEVLNKTLENFSGSNSPIKFGNIVRNTIVGSNWHYR